MLAQMWRTALKNSRRPRAVPVWLKAHSTAQHLGEQIQRTAKLQAVAEVKRLSAEEKMQTSQLCAAIQAQNVENCACLIMYSILIISKVQYSHNRVCTFMQRDGQLIYFYCILYLSDCRSRILTFCA